MKFTTVSVPPGTSFKEPKIMLATWLGAGLIRPAPGTMGTFAALPLGYLIMVAGSDFKIDQQFSAILVLSLIGMLLFWLVDLAEHLLLPWHVSVRTNGVQ